MFWPFRASKPSHRADSPLLVDTAAIVRRARRLRFAARPSALSVLAGAYHGARPGTGLTFAELRAYEPGDDVRHLDWNVTARQGRPYVRQYTEERALALSLIIDVSASMRFGADGQSKADRAAQAAALLATAAIHNGDRVGLVLVSDRVEAEIPPSGGFRQLSRVLCALAATPAISRRTNLSIALHGTRPNRRRGLLIVLSDFCGEQPVGEWRREASRQQILALRLVEPREQQLPDAGILALEDAEIGTRRLIDSHSTRVRSAYHSAALDNETRFRSWCSATGIAGHNIITNIDPIVTLIRVFHGRAVRRSWR